MKGTALQMAALNGKQVRLCDITTRLRLIRCVELDEESTPTGWMDESPIIERVVGIWWCVESLRVLYGIQLFIRNMLYWDDMAECYMNELKRLGRVKEIKD